MSFVTAGLVNPTTGTIARHPMSARRTSHIDMLFEGSAGGSLRLRGSGRDLYTDVEGAPHLLAAAAVDARLGDNKQLLDLVTEPREPAAQGLLGHEVGRGFRAALEGIEWQTTSDRDPLHLLLDDLPVAALISGYATLYDGDSPSRRRPANSGAGPDGTAARLVKEDICSGWRRDGTMMVALRSGRPLPIPVGPPAPRLDTADPIGWHHIDDLPLRSMRRRRLIDVVAGDPLTVYATFRDTHSGPDGIERVLHEYSLDATVDADTLRLVECRATPRSLPWTECPAAADSARRLEGEALVALPTMVPRQFRGTSTCTHLNDLLRSLAEVATLAAMVAGPGRG